VTQRLHRIVAIRAIHGAKGAMHFRTIDRFNIHFAAGTRIGGTQALTVPHRNALTPSGPNALPGHMLMQRPHPIIYLDFYRNFHKNFEIYEPGYRNGYKTDPWRTG